MKQQEFLLPNDSVTLRLDKCNQNDPGYWLLDAGYLIL